MGKWELDLGLAGFSPAWATHRFGMAPVTCIIGYWQDYGKYVEDTDLMTFIGDSDDIA